MTKRGTDGWAGLVDMDDEPPAEHTIVDEAEDGPTPREPLPALKAESKPSLKLPIPVAPAAAAGRKVSIAQPPPVSRSHSSLAPPRLPSSFSGDHFIDKIAGPLGSGATAPAQTGSKWREYRELIVTIVVGIFLLGGAIAWKMTHPPELAEDDERSTPLRAGQRRIAPRTSPSAAAPSPPRPQVAPLESASAAPEPPPPDPTPPDPVPAAPEATQPPEPAAPSPLPVAAESAAPAPSKAATPMLTIITIPSEADVEINEQFIGRSPLITTAPPGTLALRVKVSKTGHESIEQELAPNTGGHFSASFTLPAKKPR